MCLGVIIPLGCLAGPEIVPMFTFSKELSLMMKAEVQADTCAYEGVGARFYNEPFSVEVLGLRKTDAQGSVGGFLQVRNQDCKIPL